MESETRRPIDGKVADHELSSGAIDANVDEHEPKLTLLSLGSKLKAENVTRVKMLG